MEMIDIIARNARRLQRLTEDILQQSSDSCNIVARSGPSAFADQAVGETREGDGWSLGR